jgi:23S rRNA (guanosine2251-2'-O)-methyltransferase
VAPRPVGGPGGGSSGKPRRSRPGSGTGGARARGGGRSPGGGPPADAESRRPRAPAEKRRDAGPAADGRAAKQARRRDQLEAARAAVRPGPDRELIEGRRPVIEALRSGRPVDRVLVATGGSAGGTLADLLALARDHGVPVETVPRSLIDAEAATGAHQGVLAVVAPIEPISLDELLAIPLGSSEPPFLLALDGVEDPRNLGALARSADAAGCHGMIVPRHRSAPLSAVAVKASAGALEHLPVAEVANLTRALDRLRESGVWCVGLDGEADTGLFDLDLVTEPVCVVVGSEGAGLHRLVREACDVAVRIPMTGHVESLNASVAGALALFEVRRRRSAPASQPAGASRTALAPPPPAR